ncbi:MAG: class I SAM-dependent methyltransferase [Chitinophagaceae bacterium]|nr:class I SAM-dependent methyltransferase [Chitinophagaceae bacterium]
MWMKQPQSYLIRWGKHILPSSWANQVRNQLLYWRYADKNRRFVATHPDLNLPPLPFLAEIFKPDYTAYVEQGSATVAAIMPLIKPYLSANAKNALDWGCGTGRLTTHLQKLLESLDWYACDVRADMIQWNQNNLAHINFAITQQEPPLPFQHVKFDLIIGFSVFTHIPAALQQAWLNALSENLADDGIVLFTTHGSAYQQHLSTKQQSVLAELGCWDNHTGNAGSRSRAIYHHASKFHTIIEQYMDVLSWYDGAKYPSLIGGQDIWICKKKSRNCGTEND